MIYLCKKALFIKIEGVIVLAHFLQKIDGDFSKITYQKIDKNRQLQVPARPQIPNFVEIGQAL